MKNIKHKNIPNIQIVGVVTKKEDNFFIVETNKREIKTLKAVSCVIEPEIGDKVLVFRQDNSEAYILSILHRESSEQTIVVDKLNIQTNSLNLNSLEINTKSLSLNSTIEKISVVSAFVEIKTKVIKNISQSVYNVFSFFKQTDESHSQITKKHLDIQSETSRKIVKQTDMTITKNSFLKAKDEVRIDGNLINLA